MINMEKKNKSKNSLENFSFIFGISALISIIIIIVGIWYINMGAGMKLIISGVISFFVSMILGMLTVEE